MLKQAGRGGCGYQGDVCRSRQLACKLKRAPFFACSLSRSSSLIERLEQAKREEVRMKEEKSRNGRVIE